jgi:hypothetical protein
MSEFKQMMAAQRLCNDYAEVIPTERGKEKNEVATVWSNQTGGRDGAKRYARLFAAAPELLDALESLLAVQNGSPLPSYEKDYENAVNAAKAAIWKAKGGE